MNEPESHWYNQPHMTWVCSEACGMRTGVMWCQQWATMGHDELPTCIWPSVQIWLSKTELYTQKSDSDLNDSELQWQRNGALAIYLELHRTNLMFCEFTIIWPMNQYFTPHIHISHHTPQILTVDILILSILKIVIPIGQDGSASTFIAASLALVCRHRMQSRIFSSSTLPLYKVCCRN